MDFRSFDNGLNSYTNRFLLCKNIGITHVFSFINICRVPRMLFEHEAERPSVQHHPRDRQVFMQ